MYLIEQKRNGEWVYDPGTTMAIQEYVKDNIFLDEDIVFPYMMYPAVQIGKFQNAYEEVNQPYMDKHGMKVVRRVTGGGAIYLDNRNMSYSFLLRGTNGIYGNYGKLFEPAIRALHKLGVDPDLLQYEGRNDLVLDGKKVSGAAMTIEHDRVYAGFSLLTDPNYEAMAAVLNPNQKKIESHGIQSVRSRVGSIRPYLAEKYRDISLEKFTEFMICELLEIDDMSKAKRYELTVEDWEGIDKLAAEKYNNWDWNYGRFQEFEYRLTERFPIGTASAGLTIEHGKIAKIQIYGDFFGVEDIKAVEDILLGVRLRKDELNEALDSVDLTAYFGKLPQEDFISFLLSE